MPIILMQYSVFTELMQRVHIYENKEDIVADAVPVCISYKCILISTIIFMNLK